MFDFFKTKEAPDFIYSLPSPVIKEYKSFYRMLEFSDEFNKRKCTDEEIDQLEALKRSIDRHIEHLKSEK